MEKFQLPIDAKPCKIKELLKNNGISLTNWRKLKQTATFYIDQVEVGFNTTIYPKQTLSIKYNIKSNIIPEQHPLEIVYEDDFLLIVNKDAGILVHPTVSQASGTLANFVAFYLENTGNFNEFHPVSRLDKDTSGVVLIAKTPRIQHMLSKINIDKQYIALLSNTPPAQIGFINLPIARKETSIIEREISTTGKQSLTYYEIIEKYNNNSCLVSFKLLTGRTHQLRVHTAAINCAIYADSLYGIEVLNSRQALHAQSLQFLHPITKKLVFVQTKLPLDIKKVVSNLSLV